MNSMINKQGGLHDISGFAFGGITVGDSSKKNLGIIFSEQVNTVGAAVYTQNDVKAAPVLVSQQHDQAQPNKRAILINSGTANAFTGKQGHQDALRCVKEVSDTFQLDPADVYIGSTGCIGVELPMAEILDGISQLARNLSNTQQAASDFNHAILTTDTRTKQASIQYEYQGHSIEIGGCVKGAGMIMPNMATMLSCILTNAAISQEMLQCALSEAVNRSFNCATVDGDTSTNDSVFALANQTAGNAEICYQEDAYRVFTLHLTRLLEHLAKEMIGDGEGITKFITIRTLGVPTLEQGKKIAFSIANSPLVKTALFGEQMNWGRILMAAGKAQTGLSFDNVSLTINDVAVLRESEVVGENAVSEAEATLKGRDIFLDLNLHQGHECFTAWTCDFSYDYVKINADYIS